MTLFKQFLLGSLLFTLLILGVVGINDYLKTKEFLSDQLGANAEHTAISLGLVISSEANKALDLASDDLSDVLGANKEQNQEIYDYSQFINEEFLKSLINPIVDSGYYSQISFKDAKGELVYKAVYENNFFDADSWFVDLIQIPVPVVEREVRGWNKIGTISVQISPVFAYKQMYSLFTNLTFGLFIVFLCAFLLLYFAIKAMLAPLSQVRKQAEAILDKEFIIQEKLPFTQEVRKVVEAMNTMVGKVKSIFEKEAQMLEHYNDLLYLDETSQLYNRRYFVNKYKEYIASEQYSSGYFLLISIKENYNIKKYLGFEKSVEFNKELAKILRSCMITKNENICRLNENDFGLIIFDKYELINAINKTLDKIKLLFAQYMLDETSFDVKAALVYFDNTPLNELLAKADILLIQNHENFSLNGTLQSNTDTPLSKQAFKELITNAMQKDEFCFASQDVLEDGAIFQEELYLRLRTADGELKSAAYFMPIVQELQLCDELDFYVLSKALKYAKDLNHYVAINLSPSFIKSKNYDRLSEILNAANCSQICFELAMSKELKINELIAFAKFIRRWNIQLGLDHFGLSKENLMILNELNVSYVKTPVNLLLDLLEDSSTSGAANSLDIILNSKNVKIIAIGIESALSSNAIKRLNLSAMQGRYISQIKDI